MKDPFYHITVQLELDEGTDQDPDDICRALEGAIIDNVMDISVGDASYVIEHVEVEHPV